MKSTGYAICSIACLAIHIARLAGDGLVIRHAVDWGVITGNRVGSKATRQGGWKSWLAGMFAVCKSPPGLAYIADRYLRILARDGLAARERVKPESDKTVNAGEYP